MDRDIRLLTDGCRDLGISLSERQIEQFLIFYEALTEKNKVMNLTTITEFSEVVAKHFLDSLALVKAVDFSSIRKVMDIGTGAGFPGIPLKIVFPQAEFVLLDSLNKRIRFLDEVVSACALEKVTPVHGRAEELARKKEYREQFDLCVSRAVANLSSLSEYCLPYVKVGGLFVSYKSGSVDEELAKADRAVSILGGKLSSVVRFQLFTQNGEPFDRSLVVIQKKKATPVSYPRKPGLPSKEPL